jgi:hypothetical protein
MKEIKVEIILDKIKNSEIYTWIQAESFDWSREKERKLIEHFKI